MLDLVYENQTGDRKWTEEFFHTILSKAASHLKLDDKKVECGLHLITPERSQELNRTHRHKDKPTDVLSFPLNEHALEQYDILPVGDIFICLEVAERQAEEMKIPLDQELARLAVHGFLHLVGYDHETSPEDEKKMIDLQEDIIKNL
jgi:probable rRNA maturation factor